MSWHLKEWWLSCFFFLFQNWILFSLRILFFLEATNQNCELYNTIFRILCPAISFIWNIFEELPDKKVIYITSFFFKFISLVFLNLFLKGLPKLTFLRNLLGQKSKYYLVLLDQNKHVEVKKSCIFVHFNC